MIRNLKPLGLALAAVMAFAAVAAGAVQANAPRWKVEGKFLSATDQPKTFHAISETTATLGTPNLKVNFDSPPGKCTVTGRIVGSPGGAPGTLSEVTMTCTEVTVEGAPSCKVKSPGEPVGAVRTNHLAGTLVWLKNSGSEAGLLFKPASGANFVVIEVEGCPAAGLYPVSNEIIGRFTPVEQEVETATVDFPVPPILKWWSNATPRVEQTIKQLTVQKQPATFGATFEMALSPEEAFGIFPG